MAIPASAPMSAAPSARSHPMSRLATLASTAEPTKASEALVEVLSATLAPSNTAATPAAAAVRSAPTLPGKVEPAHSLAHTAGAPVAVIPAADHATGAGAAPESAEPVIGLGHALPNTDTMTRQNSTHSAAAAHGAAGFDPSPLIVHHLRQLINDEIGRADGAGAAMAATRSAGGAGAPPVLPVLATGGALDADLGVGERLRTAAAEHRAGSGLTNYLSARASLDSRSTVTASGGTATDGKAVSETAALVNQLYDPDRVGPMAPSKAHLPLAAATHPSPVFPNFWAKARYHMREPLAEALGTFILVIFGNGINAQVSLSRLVDPTAPKGDFLSVNFGWGIGVMLGVYVAGGISGGHINPAVTLSFAVFRGFPWKKVPFYILGQLIGAFLGALLIYGVYSNPLHSVDPDHTELTAAIFATYPVDYLRTSTTRISCFLNEAVGSAILLLVIMALGDSNNTPPVDGMAPLALLWLVVGIGSCLGWQTSYAINPARDLGPRLMLWAVGYAPDVLWTFDALYFLWAPCLATIVGGLFGSFLYDFMCYTGAESPLNAEIKLPSCSRASLFRRRRASMSKTEV